MQEHAPTREQQAQVRARATSPGTKLLTFLLALGIAGFSAKQFLTTPSMQDIENKVATDAVAQYEIVKRSGDAVQTCVHAGMVSAAFVQAKDEANFKIWHETEKVDCAKAGMPK